jgi:hypothetical protein
MAFAVGAHHVGEKKIHVEARAVLHQRNAVPVEDVAPNGRDSNRNPGARGHFGCVFCAPGDLHVPKTEDKGRDRQEDDRPEEIDAVWNLSALHCCSTL